MSSLIARWGQTGVPRATEAVWRADKRRTAQWTCRLCQQKRQARLFHDLERSRRYTPHNADKYEADVALQSLLFQRSQDSDVSDVLVPSPADVYSRAYSERRHIPSRAGRYAVNALKGLDYKADLMPALDLNNVDLVARCLIAAETARDEDFLSSISNEDFSRILRALGTTNSHLSRLESIHRQFSDKSAKRLNLRRRNAIAVEYTRILKAVYLIREKTGSTGLSLKDYTVLLQTARDLGQWEFCQLLWDRLDAQGLVPDVNCWNAYMAGRLCQGGWRSITGESSRPETFHELVQEQRLGLKRGHPLAQTGILNTARMLHQTMLKAGVEPNVDSYVLMLTAAGREGDVKAVEALLKNVWGLDLERPADATPVVQMDRGSPLFPTQQLLIALADAFCSNWELSKALKSIDFFSSQFGIKVGAPVWDCLLEMSLMLSTPRTGRFNTVLGIRNQHLAARSVEQLWDTMTSPPHKVQPTMTMYARLIKSLYLRKLPTIMLQRMEEARQIYREDVVNARNLQQAYRVCSRTTPKQNDASSKAAIAETRDDWEYAELVRLRSHGRMKAWVKLLLGLTSAHPAWEDYSFHLRELPRFLWRWLGLAPSYVRYETEGGLVEFQIRSDKEMLKSAERRKHILERKRAVEDDGLELEKKVFEDAMFEEFSRKTAVRPTKRLQKHRRQQRTAEW